MNADNPAHGWANVLLSWIAGGIGNAVTTAGYLGAGVAAITLGQWLLAATLVYTILQIFVTLRKLFIAMRRPLPLLGTDTDRAGL